MKDIWVFAYLPGFPFYFVLAFCVFCVNQAIYLKLKRFFCFLFLTYHLLFLVKGLCYGTCQLYCQKWNSFFLFASIIYCFLIVNIIHVDYIKLKKYFLKGRRMLKSPTVPSYMFIFCEYLCLFEFLYNLHCTVSTIS